MSKPTSGELIRRRVEKANVTPIDQQEVEQEYTRLVEHLVSSIRKEMERQELTQYELAKRIGHTNINSIKRLTSTQLIRDVRLSTLNAVAAGLHKRLEIRFVDEDEA